MEFKILLMLFKLSLLQNFLLTTNLVESSKIRSSNLKVCDPKNSPYANKTEKIIFESCMIPMKQSIQILVYLNL